MCKYLIISAPNSQPCKYYKLVFFFTHLIYITGLYWIVELKKEDFQDSWYEFYLLLLLVLFRDQITTDTCLFLNEKKNQYNKNCCFRFQIKFLWFVVFIFFFIFLLSANWFFKYQNICDQFGQKVGRNTEKKIK